MPRLSWCVDGGIQASVVFRQSLANSLCRARPITRQNLGEREGQLLPRSLESIRADIADWIVAEDNACIVGVGSLVEMNHSLVEVRSLAVAPEYRKFGIGGKIVYALVDQARARCRMTVFALTRAVLFFEKLGFRITDKENFPEKVWRDCSVCPVQFACDEVAMVMSVGSQS